MYQFVKKNFDSIEMHGATVQKKNSCITSFSIKFGTAQLQQQPYQLQQLPKELKV